MKTSQIHKLDTFLYHILEVCTTGENRDNYLEILNKRKEDSG